MARCTPPMLRRDPCDVAVAPLPGREAQVTKRSGVVYRCMGVFKDISICIRWVTPPAAAGGVKSAAPRLLNVYGLLAIGHGCFPGQNSHMIPVTSFTLQCEKCQDAHAERGKSVLTKLRP